MIEKLIVVIFAFLLLLAFSYIAFHREKIKNAYHLLIGCINLWCITIFIYVFKTDYNYKFALFNVVLSLLFHFFNSKPHKITIYVCSIAVWIFTVVSILACFSGIGAIALFFTQPIVYIFGLYLVEIKIENIEIPLFINLLITWFFFIFLTTGVFNI